jgi:hypothetical protein
VRLVYLLTHAGLFRNFDSTLRLLAERGHEVHVGLDSPKYPSAALDALVAAHPNLTVGRTPTPADDRWQALGRAVRAGSDYVRYLDPRYADAPKLRARARRAVPPWLRPIVRPGPHLGRVDAVLRRIEASLPIDAAVLDWVRERTPDVLLLSPLFNSPFQLEAVRAARALGVPSCLTVASWDNLTNKGLIRVAPDTVVVWNEAQRREAVDLHQIPDDRVVVTGAQNFDEWFARSATSPAWGFKQRLGLRPDRPYLLYLGSSSFIAPDEVSFARRWLRALRTSEEPGLRDIGVLFRPHPQNARQWSVEELVSDPQVAIHPSPEDTPQATGRADWSREDFYDSMAHAAAVVGVNTTAMIESAVVGKGVYTVLDPDFAETQGGTLHFEHLRAAGGGLLHERERLEEHVVDLAAAVADGAAPDERSRRFVAAFVRPHGLDRPVTPIMVDALECAADRVPDAHPVPALRPGPPMRALAAVAVAADRAAATIRRPPKRLRRGVKRSRALLGRVLGRGAAA